MKSKVLLAARKLIGSGVTPSQIKAADLVAVGACSESEFTQHFADLAAFQRDLANLLFGEAREAVIKSTAGHNAGLQQLCAAFTTYLDYNLTDPALQELAHHIQCEPQGWDLLMRMEIGVALVAQADLEAMGATLCAARARLLTSLAVTVVRAEYKAKKKLPDMRDALLDYCKLSVDR